MMKKISFLSLLLVTCLAGYTQLLPVQDCGTRAPAKPFRVDMSLTMRPHITFPLLIKVFIHVIADDDGSNVAAGDSSIERQMEFMRQYYAPQNICFILGGKQQINNTDLNNMNTDTEAGELTPHLVGNMLNIFIHNALMNNTGLVNGNAYDIPKWYLSMVSTAITSTTNVSTLAHEVGHDFGLLHTHETAFGVENVPRSGNCSNCNSAGDGLCDTPGDPNLDVGNVVTAACVYTGNMFDGCGNAYVPDPRNLMAYGNRTCRNVFTNGQGTLARAAIQNTLGSLIAPDDIAITNMQFIASGRVSELARNNVIVNSSQYVITGAALADLSATRVQLLPGTRFTPANGYVRISPNTLCQ
jgi:hypothetical protein